MAGVQRLAQAVQKLANVWLRYCLHLDGSCAAHIHFGNTMREVKIKHPEWLAFSKPNESISLFKRGLMPKCIAGWMIVVGLKHPLRAVYGSDLRAALALLWWAIWEPMENKLLAFKYRKEIKGWEEEWATENEVRDLRNAAVKN